MTLFSKEMHKQEQAKTLPRVTVVTPSYNQAQYLDWTIRSVLDQEYPNLEYIIVDGGSTDGSVEIIQRYESQLAWWVSEADDGQADAINKGFRRATGEIVAWLNSDDLYAPGAILQAVEALMTDPNLGFVYGNAASVDKDGQPMNDMTFANWGLEDLAAFNIICQPAIFMRRSVLEQAGFLDESYNLLLDHYLWLQMARIAPIHYIPKLWAFARFHPAAKNVALAPGYGKEAYRIMDWMLTQPDLTEVVNNNRSKTYAGAHRLNARYLLDGDLAWPALKAYLRSLVTHPATALKEWHRIVFAGLSIVGLSKLGELYYQRKRQIMPASMKDKGITSVHEFYNKA